MDQWQRYAQSARTFYAANFLPHRCTVERQAAGSWSTLESNVPCRFVPADPSEWALAPGAIVGKRMYGVRFGEGTLVAVGDRLTRTDISNGEQPRVRGVRPIGAYEPTIEALAEWVA